MDIAKRPDRLYQSARGIGEVPDLTDQVFIVLESELIHIGRDREPALYQFGDPLQVIETTPIGRTFCMTTLNRNMSLKNYASFY